MANSTQKTKTAATKAEKTTTTRKSAAEKTTTGKVKTAPKRTVTRASSASRTKVTAPEPIVIKKTSGFALFLLAILAIAGIGFGFVGMMTSIQVRDELASLRTRLPSMSTSSTVTEPEAEKVEETTEVEEKQSSTSGERTLVAGDLAFAGTKFQNNDTGIVYVNSTSELEDTLAVELKRNIENGKNELKVKVRMDTLNQIFGTSYPANADWAESNTSGLEADNIVDVKVGKLGQGAPRDLAILFLLKDGSVGYCTAEGMLKNGVTIEGGIAGVDDVIMLQEVTVSTGFGEERVVMAVKENGEFYKI